MHNGHSPHSPNWGRYSSSTNSDRSSTSSYNDRSPTGFTPGGGPSHNDFSPGNLSYDGYSGGPISPYSEPRSPPISASAYDTNAPVSPYNVVCRASPYDTNPPASSYERLAPVSPYKGRSLSSSSNGSISSQGPPCIQAHLSPPNQLPRVSEHQLKSLEANFKDNRNPSDLDITIIGAEVGLPEPEVKRWFEHRLARWRQQQGLPANSTSVTD